MSIKVELGDILSAGEAVSVWKILWAPCKKCPIAILGCCSSSSFIWMQSWKMILPKKTRMKLILRDGYLQAGGSTTVPQSAFHRTLRIRPVLPSVSASWCSFLLLNSLVGDSFKSRTQGDMDKSTDKFPLLWSFLLQSQPWQPFTGCLCREDPSGLSVLRQGFRTFSHEGDWWWPFDW